MAQKPQQRDSTQQDAVAKSGRWFDLTSPLGDEVLVVTEVVGEEAVSALYHVQVTVFSELKTIQPTDLLLKEVNLSFGAVGSAASASGTSSSSTSNRGTSDRASSDRATSDRGTSDRDASASATSGGAKPRRYLDGIVTRFRAGRTLRNGLREYRLVVSPQLWTWQRTSRYKVYQNKSAKDIILAMLGDDSSVKFKNNLTGTYDSREYCIQYDETDFDFFSRLAAEEGIFYYFLHESDKHTLVLEDSATWSSATAVDVAYNPEDELSYDLVNGFETGPGLIDAKYTATDYDFENPSTQIKGTGKTSKTPSASQSWERQVHGIRLPTQGSAQGAAGTEIASTDGHYELGQGRGTDPRLLPGFVFQIPAYVGGTTGDDTDSRTSTSKTSTSKTSTRKSSTTDTSRRDDDTASGGSGGAASGTTYAVTSVRHDGYEPAFGLRSREDKRPIYRNSFGCIPAKVPLPSPVPPQKPIARGPATGLVVGPSGSEIHTDKYGRIKVQFYWDLLGSKDDTSSCFIRVAQPWAGKNWGAVFLPRVGMEVVVHFLDGDPDRPLVAGTVYNGTNMPPWTLPDTMNKSGILTRSTKSGETANANELSFDDTKGSEIFLLHAEKDHQREVENDETITVGHDQISEVKNDRTITVKEGKDTLTVETGDRVHTIKQGNDTLEVTTGNRSQTIKTGNDTLEVTTGNRAVNVKTGNHDLKLALGNASTVCDAGAISIQAMQSVKLTCGMNTLELTPEGIKLNGVQVSLQATAMLEEKAPMISVKADAMAQIEGGIVQIN